MSANLEVAITEREMRRGTHFRYAGSRADWARWAKCGVQMPRFMHTTTKYEFVREEFNTMFDRTAKFASEQNA